jgi:hypothetical protein
MGNLFLINESFETQNIPEIKRDKLLINFCKALDLAIKGGDTLYSTNEIHTHQFSYGSLLYGFLLQSITEVSKEATLKGVSELALSLYQSIAFTVPNIVKTSVSEDQFESQFGLLHFGYSGFDFPEKKQPYVGCNICWHAWKRNWLTSHQKEIIWPKEIDENRFLPNKFNSDLILYTEIIKFEQEESVRKKEKVVFDKSNPGLIFHDKVMRSKGGDLAAFTKEIGGKIASINFYIFDADLSKNESIAFGGTLRTIYKLIGEDGLYKYISLDHKHGMFEFHNHKGEHLGEYKFDGSFTSKAEVSHNLRTL